MKGAAHRRLTLQPLVADGLVSFIVASPHLPTVGDAVRSVLDQSLSPVVGEIILGGPDHHGVLPSDPRIVMLEDLPPAPACLAYNEAIRVARHEYVVILDGDCLLEHDWLEHVRGKHDEGWHVVHGAIDVPSGPYWSMAYNYSNFHEFRRTAPAGPRGCLPTMALSLRRSVIEDVGAVPDDMPRVYDYEWTARMTEAGYRLLFAPEARASHHPCGITPGILWRTWHAGGSCSQAVRLRHSNTLPCPRLLDRPRTLAVLSPMVAFAVTLRIVAQQPTNWRIVAVAPAIWMTKVAWCLGASAGRRTGAISLRDYPIVVPDDGRRQRGTT